MNGSTALEVLEMVDDRLKGEVDKVRFIAALSDTCTDPNDVFNFTDPVEKQGAWAGLFRILDDMVHAFDEFYKRLEEKQINGLPGGPEHADGH